MNRKPFIVIFHITLFIIGTYISITKLADQNRFELSVELLGIANAYFDYFMDTVMLAISIFLFYGYFKAKKWAYKSTFYYYGAYFIGRFAGLFIAATKFDKVMEIASIIKYGEIRPNPITLGGFVWIFVVVTLIQLLISYFALRSLYRNRDYFTN